MIICTYNKSLFDRSLIDLWKNSSYLDFRKMFFSLQKCDYYFITKSQSRSLTLKTLKKINSRCLYFGRQVEIQDKRLGLDSLRMLYTLLYKKNKTEISIKNIF